MITGSDDDKKEKAAPEGDGQARAPLFPTAEAARSALRSWIGRDAIPSAVFSTGADGINCALASAQRRNIELDPTRVMMMRLYAAL
jgi:hypothetical protein